MAKHLSPKQIAEGLETCAENVESLFDDALFLFENKKYARAASIAVSCLEEFGKMEKLKELLQMEKDDKERIKKFWKDFRSHGIKTTTALTSSNVRTLKTATDVNLMSHFFEKTSSYREAVRQNGLYVDFNEQKGTWHSPKNLRIDEVKQILYAANQVRLLVIADKLSGINSAEVLSLHKKHFKPIWDLLKNNKDNTSTHSILRALDNTLLRCQVSFYKELLNKNSLKTPDTIHIRNLPLKEFLKKYDSENQNE
jgi:AbiV family abortive infection protein